MLPPLTDEEWTAWLTDLEPYYGQDRPLADAFLRLSRRCADAEARLVPQSCAGCLRVCGVRDSVRGCEDYAGAGVSA